MTTSTINIKLILDSCSVKEKVELFKQLYKDIASCGIHGDTELAHVNPFEAGILKLLGGAGTVNEATGLVQYFGGGSPPPPPPSTQSVSQTSEFPTELKPYITDVLSKAQAIQEKREAEGFVPYTGPQQAAFTPEQEQAFTGIQSLVGAGQQYFDPAARLTAASAMAPTSAEIGQYMSPYMQQVVDIQQREARRAADVEQQQLAAQAVGAGGYGGSRQAILEAEQRRNLQTQLGDIQAKGLAAAYEDAQARLAAQRQREMAAGAQFGTLGQVAPQQALKELTAVEAVGAQRQAQQQTALDIARQQFEKEQTFPETTLQQYQSVIRGFPLQPTTYQTSQTTTPAPSYLQQAAGLGMAGVGLAGAFGAFKADGGLIRRAKGGKLDKNGGLGSIVIKRALGGSASEDISDLFAKRKETRRTISELEAKLAQLGEERLTAKESRLSKAPWLEAIRGGLSLAAADPTKPFVTQFSEAAMPSIENLSKVQSEREDLPLEQMQNQLKNKLAIAKLQSEELSDLAAYAKATKEDAKKFSSVVNKSLTDAAASVAGVPAVLDEQGNLRSIGNAPIDPEGLKKAAAIKAEAMKIYAQYRKAGLQEDEAIAETQGQLPEIYERLFAAPAGPSSPPPPPTEEKPSRSSARPRTVR